MPLSKEEALVWGQAQKYAMEASIRRGIHVNINGIYLIQARYDLDHGDIRGDSVKRCMTCRGDGWVPNLDSPIALPVISSKV